jgi:hypothetical protein
MDDSELIRAQNVNGDILGALTRRLGYVKYLDNPDSMPVLTLFNWNKIGTSRLLRVSGTSIYKYNFSGTTWGPAIKNNLTSGKKMAMATLNNLVFMTNGFDTPMTYDDNIFTNISDGALSGQKPTTAVTWKGRVWAAGDVTAPTVVWFSKSNDPTSWTNNPNDVSTGNNFAIDKDDGNAITKLRVVNDRLLIYKKNGTYKVIPSDVGTPATVIKIPTVATCTSMDGVADVDTYAVSFDRLGAWANSGDRPLLISNQVEDLMYGMDPTFVGKESLGSWRNKVYIAIGTVTEDARFGGKVYQNTVMVYDWIGKAWYMYTFAHQPNTWLTFTNPSGVEGIFFGAANGQVYQYGVGDLDDTLPIDAEAVMKPYFFGNPEQDKNIKLGWFFHNPGIGAEIEYSFDDLYGVGPFSSVGPLNTKGRTKMYFPAGSNSVKSLTTKVSQDKVGRPFIYYGGTFLTDFQGVR